ncbi:T9SS type A sorting domain-containing protein [Seonamhaeicola maritimus]|uniref:T9SS type A sorting domain-containing protein n=1 Tax=Seonamhaeicola maritimus TaxID=2591822 RepID=A0A5C7GEI2_9FLAO|nr:T9SS type A sorting domain-containing protein [Seonamhaeicola maritimus]TXG35137.1 T9SS type A sorting domain-containing protein [Seonamhaeicola maritimus]
MMKKLLLLLTLTLTITSYSQVNVTYETGGQAYTLGTNGGVTLNEAISNDEKTGINLSDNCGRITETNGAFDWDFAVWNDPKFNLNAAQGHFISLKVLSKNETSFTLKAQTRHWTGAANEFNQIEQTVNVALNTWTTVEFDFSSATFNNNWTNQFAFQFNSANGARDGDVYYIDDIVQSTNSVLGVEDKSLNKLTISPNPVTNRFNIPDYQKFKSVSIYNLIGQEVKQLTSERTIDVSDLTSGIYILKTDTGSTSKFVKQ